MASLNTKSRTTHRTYESAPARRIKPEQQLERSIMSCLLGENEFYENGQRLKDRITKEAAACSPEFVAQTAIAARTTGNLRHAPLWLALSLMPRGGNIAGDTLAKIINRPDELSEAVAMYWENGKRPLSKQMKRGLAKAFTKFNAHNLAKYNRDKDVKLRDVMFLCHPKPINADQEKTFKQLANNSLPTPDTWEVALSTGADKKTTFERLLQENNLGSLALLRNLRNMVQSNVNRNLIKNTLDASQFKGVLPFQFISAARACPELEPQLDNAMQKAMADMQPLEGKTIVLVDTSTSMLRQLSAKSALTRLDAAASLAVLIRGICADAHIFTFTTTIDRHPARHGMALADSITNAKHGGTDLGKAVAQMNREDYDRLIVITDEQSNSVVPNPITDKGYMINVASYQNGIGYGPWIHIDGFSTQFYNFMIEHEEFSRSGK